MSDLVTGEAVVLDLPSAGFASRAVALFIDVVVQAGLALLAVVAVTSLGSGVDPATTAAVSVLLTLLILVGYPTLFETLSRGRSLGKLALGLRVVGDDGGPVRFRQALVRGLAGIVDFWLLAGAVALVVSLVNSRGKRLGDILAGTHVVQARGLRRREVRLEMPAELRGWAATAELAMLSDDLAVTVRNYLDRYAQFTDETRASMGARLASAVGGQVSPPPPPGTPPPAYLAAVLAERQARAERRAAERAASAARTANTPAPRPGAPGGFPAQAAPPAAPAAPPRDAPPDGGGGRGTGFVAPD